MNALRQLWSDLAPRDQRILFAGGLFLLLVLVWIGLWEPLRTARDAARVRVTASSSDLATMRAIAPRLRELGGSATTPADTRSLLVLVDATARESVVGDALLRVEPVAGDQVRVYFEGVGFDALVEWLEQLQARHGIGIAELGINRAAGVGRVDARLLLQRRGD